MMYFKFSTHHVTFEPRECHPLLYQQNVQLKTLEPVEIHSCDSSDQGNNYDTTTSPSRRPSAIIAALRRPSQAVALSAAHAVMNQRRYLLG